MSKKKPINPFYVVLVLTGIAFCLTSACYLQLMLRSQRLDAVDANLGGGLLAFVDRHGNRLFAAELLVLGVATVGAITTDQYWIRRAIAERGAPTPNERENSHEESR
jgi:hypothetical protein